MRILICGGAGYIGSHMTKLLLEEGHSVRVLDNLRTGHREAVPDGLLIEADLLDRSALQGVFSTHAFDAVMHFSALSLVSESVARPYEYYINNVIGGIHLIEAMLEAGVSKLVFSSTAAVYGTPCREVIDEEHRCAPINPYGQSKRMLEVMLNDGARAHGLRSVSLRYFNAAGADPGGLIGEAHCPESHLIPNAIRAAVGGEVLRVFGDDYPTPDGTCVRDYVHVNDLAAAHLKALTFMDENEGAHVFNLGNGEGFSVRQVIDAVGDVVGKPVAYEIAERRLGDPAVLVASSKKAHAHLGWRPQYTELASILETAWRWHRNQRF